MFSLMEKLTSSILPCCLDHVIATTDGHDLLPISSNPSGRLSLAFSTNARFLAVLDHSRPQVLWIWDIPRLSLQSVLIHISPIKG